MSDTDGKKPLGLGGTPRSGQVKQSFSHGRTKSVVVETKRKRVVVPKPGAPGVAPAAGVKSHLGDPSKRPAGISDAEMERRLTALRAAKARLQRVQQRSRHLAQAEGGQQVAGGGGGIHGRGLRQQNKGNGRKKNTTPGSMQTGQSPGRQCFVLPGLCLSAAKRRR